MRKNRGILHISSEQTNNIMVGNRLTVDESMEAIKCQIDLMEKEILYFRGIKRRKAKRAYLRLLHSCGETCKIDEPIYLERSE